MHDRSSPIGDFFFSRFSTKHDSVDKLRRLSRADSICSEQSENTKDLIDRVGYSFSFSYWLVYLIKRQNLYKEIWTVKKYILQFQEKPKYQNELLEFVKDLVRVYRKTSQLREVVQNMAWIQVCIQARLNTINHNHIS